MKKILALLLAVVTCLCFAACFDIGGSTDTPPAGDPPRRPSLRGDSVALFGKNDGFDLVFCKGDADAEAAAGDLAAAIAAEGLKTPTVKADADKTENKCELLIGETSRALSADAKAALADKIAAEPHSEHWIWLYRDGQLALYANNPAAYGDAIADLIGKYFKAGEIKVKLDLNEIGYYRLPQPDVSDNTVTILGGSESFVIVFGEADESGVGAVADLISLLTGAGIASPESVKDSEKRETKCEILVGETNRALSQEAKALLADKLAEKPDDEHSIILYKNGQLAIYANCQNGYELALSAIGEKYCADGSFKLPCDICEIGYHEQRHKAYMEYDLPTNFYDGYTDPFGMKDGDYKPMTIKKHSAILYYVTYTDENGTFSTELLQRSWGTWAMGQWKFTDKKGDNHFISGSSTDYEFVLRIGADTPVTLRSGNHGDYPGDKTWSYYLDDSSKSNDRLLDMTFYDGKSGEKIVLENIGDSITVNGLRVVMHHNIYELNYAEENVLVNAERSYLYNGHDVSLDTKLYMTKDVKLERGFSYMFPVMKDYGNCAIFYREDGSSYFMKTEQSGGKDHVSLGIDAVSVDLFGEKNPEYHVKITVGNPEEMYRDSVPTSVNPEQGYAGIRNMQGGTTNKIYGSLFSAGGELDWGDELHFNTTWSFSYQPGFTAPTTAPDRWVGLK